MAVATTEFAYNDQLNWTQTIYDFASQYDNRLTMSNGKIRFDNKFSLSFSWSGTSLNATLTYDSDGSTKTIMTNDPNDNPYWASSGTCMVMLINDNKNFYITFTRKQYTNQAHGALVIFKTDSGSYLAGGKVGQSSSTNYLVKKDINSYILYDCIDKVVPPLKFGHIAQYELSTPKILYAQKVPVVQEAGAGNIELISSAFACSTVGFGNTITINGKNYYCAGSNILLPIGA